MQKPPPVEVGITRPAPPPKQTISPLAAAVVLGVLTGIVCGTILGVVWMVTSR